MYAELPVRYPKGTYKICVIRKNGSVNYLMVNLSTSRQYESGSIFDMVCDIEADLSANKFPHNTIQYRAWNASETVEVSRTSTNIINIGDAREDAIIQTQNTPTFIVRILYRQNATWQGTVQWMEGGQTRQYRSLNELLKLMDEAIRIAQKQSAE